MSIFDANLENTEQDELHSAENLEGNSVRDTPAFYKYASSTK